MLEWLENSIIGTRDCFAMVQATVVGRLRFYTATQRGIGGGDGDGIRRQRITRGMG